MLAKKLRDTAMHQQVPFRDACCPPDSVNVGL